MTDGTPQQWLLLLLLGGVSGSVGQIVRSLAGIHKLRSEAAAVGTTPTDLFEAPRLIYSLVVGFAAGAVAAISTTSIDARVDSQLILGFAAAGYAGTDFLEAFVQSRLSPAARAATGTEPAKTADIPRGTTEPGTAPAGPSLPPAVG